MSQSRDSQPDIGIGGFSARYVSRTRELGLKDREVHRLSGISTSTLSRYRAGTGFPKSEHVFPLSDALRTTARWLLLGQHDPALVPAEDAEWVSLPEYDLRELSDEGKGPSLSSNPIRRDWLQRNLGEASNVWLARLPAAYPPLGLDEGDTVFMRDVAIGETIPDRALLLWRVNGVQVIGRHSATMSGHQLQVGDRLGEFYVNTRQIGTADEQFIPIGRVLGAPVRRL